MSPERLELILFVTYVVLGPVAWAAYRAFMIAARRRMLLMRRDEGGLPKRPPTVTILVPAKDEGERIRGCIESCLAQDYPSFNVIAINDRSTDDTGAVMDGIAAADPNGRLKVLHVTEPPAPGWTGKNNALYQGMKLADGRWVLFVDSDVVLQPDALAVSMAVVLRKRFDLISLLPKLESHTLWESTLVPLAAGAASSMYLIALNNNNLWTKTAFANGQYMLMSRAAYDQIGGHTAVRDRYCEDVAIARLMKAHNLRPRVSWGAEYAAVRMYSSLGAIFRGWSRIYYAAQVGSPWRILLAVAFVLLCGMSAWAAAGWGLYRLAQPGAALWGYAPAHWLIACALHVLLMTRALALVYAWSGNPRRNAWLFLPVSGPMLLSIFFRALKMCVTKKVEWRGTAYSHTMASDASVNGAVTTASPGDGAKPQGEAHATQT